MIIFDGIPQELHGDQLRKDKITYTLFGQNSKGIFISYNNKGKWLLDTKSLSQNYSPVDNNTAS
jgi:hypothetical protein